MSKEIMVIDIIGVEADNRCSELSISAEDLPRLFKDVGLGYLDVNQGEDNPDIRPRRYIQVLIPRISLSATNS